MTGLDHVLSMLDGPELTERSRGELALVLDIRIENAKDMIREFKHVYSEAGEI